jgi:hypothetical protein
MSRLEVDEEGAVFANGKIFKLDEEWSQNITQLYFDMVAHLQIKVSSNLI